MLKHHPQVHLGAQAAPHRHGPRRGRRHRLPRRDAGARRRHAGRLRRPVHRRLRRDRRRGPRRATPIGADTVAQQALLDRSVVDRRGCGRRGRRRRRPTSWAWGRSSAPTATAIGGDGPPALAGSWIDGSRAQPLPASSRDAHRPSRDEVAIDRASADDRGAGGRWQRRWCGCRQSVEARIVGLVDARRRGRLRWRSASPPSSSTRRNDTSPAGPMLVSQRDRGRRRRRDPRRARASGSCRSCPTVPRRSSGTDLTDEATEGISADFLDFFETFLLAFAGIALLGRGVQHLQHVLDHAWRSGPASRRCCAPSARPRGSSSHRVALEAVIVGVVASAIGVVAGLGLASGLAAVLGAVGFGIPPRRMSLDGATVAVSLGVGVVVTRARRRDT